MLISISGLPGSGTSSVAKRLQELCGYRLISAGSIFRQEADRRGISLEEFGKLADSDFSIDSALDKGMVQIATGIDDVILEGRLSGFVANHPRVRSNNKSGILRICLKAPFSVRCSRISKRDGLSQAEAEDVTLIREHRESRRHRSNYGIDVQSVSYDVVFNSNSLSVEEIALSIYSMISQKGCADD
jgi:cytidylate kinase, putative